MNFSRRRDRSFLWIFIYIVIIVSFQLGQLKADYYPSSPLGEAMVGMITIYDLVGFGLGMLMLYGLFYGIDYLISISYHWLKQSKSAD